MKRKFELREILTVTTGRLLTNPDENGGNGIGALYEILEHLTGEPPFTHTLPRFADETRPYLLRSHPELRNADVDVLDALRGEPIDRVEQWLDKCVKEWGMLPEYELSPIPIKAHARKEPMGELAGMMGHNT